jgi:hypothetical protein
VTMDQNHASKLRDRLRRLDAAHQKVARLRLPPSALDMTESGWRELEDRLADLQDATELTLLTAKEAGLT